MTDDSPRHLGEAELRQLAGGESPAGATAEHLRACTACREELRFQQGARLALGVAARGAAGDCPEDELLVRFADDWLPSDERERLERHLTACVQCAVLIEFLGRTESAATARVQEVVSKAGALVAKLRDLVQFELPVPLTVTARGGATPQAAQVEAGMEHYRAGRHAEALLDFAAAAREGDLPPAAHFLSGACQVESGDYDAAVDSYRLAVSASPGLGEYRFHLGQALVLKGEAREAIKELRRAARQPGRHQAAARELARSVEEVVRTVSS